ncbi:hypothetical protein [Micromonospora sp. NPDC049301]|uniref:hypothetical protein n=1 Tax=Micromonospora sp. NPDC049301 TaxID=3155723 RepID=UPI00343BC3A3
MNTIIRKGILGIAGLAVAGGVIAGPVSEAQASPAESKMAAVTQTGTSMSVASRAHGPQSRIHLNKTQTRNAKAIITTTKKSGMGQRAAVIAVATAMQESKLQNLGHLGSRNDHDSLGLFQQRPSSGWGTPAQVTNPSYSTRAFLKGLRQVDGWKHMPLTEAAQTVQVSAYPDAYAQWERQSTGLVATYWNS